MPKARVHAHDGVAGWCRLEVGGYAALFPVAVTSGVRPVSATDLRVRLLLASLLGSAARLGLGEGPFGGRGKVTSLRIGFHGSNWDWWLPSVLSI